VGTVPAFFSVKPFVLYLEEDVFYAYKLYL